MASKDIGSLRTRLSWEDEGSTRSLKGFKDDLRSLRSEMNAAKSGGKEYTTSLKGLRQQSDILSRTLKTQQERVKELKHRYEESKRVKGEDADQTKRLAAQYNNAVAEMNRTEQHLGRVTAEIEKQINPWKRLERSLGDAGDKMQSIGRGMTDFGKNYSLKVTAPIVAGGVAVFKAASDYESAFAGVRKTVDMTEKEFDTLSKGIRNMAKELPTAATDIAAVAESAGQLGIQNDAILGFTRTIIDLGEATNLTREQAATEFARFANIVGMSQKDFDRLGSSVVSLGNNMATTESEIVSMGMRLAAQGKQVGMNEAQIMALAATMSSLGIEAEAGGTAMTMVLKKIDQAVGAGGKSVAGFAKAAGVSSKEFSDAWKKDPIIALDLFVKGLGKSGKEGKNLSSILSDLGIKGIRESDTILRMAGASDLLAGAVDNSTKAWKDNTALTNEAAQRYKTTESQLKILWNRTKDMAITMGEALVPAFMDAIKAAEPLMKQIESGAKAFSEMEEKQQQSILKMIAFAAAVGPASIVLGNLTTGIGGVLKVGGSLAGMLGRAGGAGLVGRIGLLGLGATTPVGLAIAGVGALGLGIYALNKASSENLEKTLDSLRARQDEVKANEDLIASFEQLQKKNKLSTDEVLRYMDVMTELKGAKSEEAIKALTKEQGELLKKSGFTNDEMEEFLRLNGKIVKDAPETAKAISKQGNAYAAVLDELKKLNAEERKKVTDEYYFKVEKESRKQIENLRQQKSLNEEINRLLGDKSKSTAGILEQNDKIQKKDLEIAKVRKEIEKATKEEKISLSEKLLVLEDEKASLEGVKKKHTDTESSLDRQISKAREKLKNVDKELALFDELKDDYAQLVLYEQGIVSEKGKALQAIQKEQNQINANRKALEEFKKTGQATTSEYNEQNRKLNEQQSKLDTAKKKLADMNAVAGQTVYKDVNMRTNPSVDSLNRQLSSRVQKWVDVAIGNVRGPRFSAYAASTGYHPDNVAMVGVVV